MSNTAAILTDRQIDRLDLLASHPVVEISPRTFKSGMVLVDEFDTPVAVLDHRMAHERDGHVAGGPKWMLADLEVGGWTTTTFVASRPYRVLAREARS